MNTSHPPPAAPGPAPQVAPARAVAARVDGLLRSILFWASGIGFLRRLIDPRLAIVTEALRALSALLAAIPAHTIIQTGNVPITPGRSTISSHATSRPTGSRATPNRAQAPSAPMAVSRPSAPGSHPARCRVAVARLVPPSPPSSRAAIAVPPSARPPPKTSVVGTRNRHASFVAKS